MLYSINMTSYQQAILEVVTYYEIAPLSIVRIDSNTFTYSSETPLVVGQFVNISVGKKSLTGIVIAATKAPTYPTKEVTATLDIPTLPSALVATALWMSAYYTTPLATVLQTVLPRGLSKKRRPSPLSSSDIKRSRTKIVFTAAQQKAIASLSEMSPGSALLHGITGSGKTAVYIELAHRSLANGKSAIVLVPEIALTSQLVAEFTHHFTTVFVTHSRHTEAERHRIWLAIANSTEPCVVIGPRSALFMPISNLGLIVIDEAHEPSFKQEQAPRYSALRVASILGKQHQAKIIQGSATPLISEYYLAQHAKRPIITMSEKARTDTAAPSIKLIDMTKRSHFTRHRLFSNELLTALETSFANGNQALIFHNRRGSASTTLCESCGWSAACPRCFVSYTLHADHHRLECHICSLHERVPTSCPLCRSTDIIHKGVGTKLIEAELKKIFPNITMARFDGDTASSDTVEQRYQDLYDGNIQLIIGTQVIAKGLDLPHLRTVGVAQADAGLSLPDFAASERTFQLLAQVAGRVGRSAHPTTVIVQSYQPTAPAVQLGIGQNYKEFYILTLAERRRAHFPPFTFLLRLTCIYKTEAAAIKNAALVATKIRKQHNNVTVLGPTPAFYERVRDTYRWQLVVKSTQRSHLIDVLASVPKTHWQADLDPHSLL